MTSPRGWRACVPVLPLVLGVTDGLLNALTLAASSLVGSGAPVTVNLAIRVGVAAVVTAAFTMAVADYAERRTKLVRAGQQLNLTSRGRLATTLLGRRAAGESLRAVIVTAVASFVGAVAPLMAGTLLHGHSWIVVLLAIAALAGLGACIAVTVAGHRLRWAALVGSAGLAVTYIGTWLHLA